MAGGRYLGICQPGDRVRHYTVSKRLLTGRRAVSFVARDSANRRVFLKQYKSPTVRVPWYREFIDYQAEIKRRIESTPCQDFCYRCVEFFEEDRYYFQVFEWLDAGSSLAQILARCAENPALVSAEQRLIMAKVLMSGIHALHCFGKIVHSDLKPANLMLQEDRSIRAGYRLKIIDIDCSLLADRLAPWHGQPGQSYFGTVGYMSPEHYRGKVPQTCSDIFSCGLMLYELLADGHPYRTDDEDRIRDATLAGRALAPKLLPGLDALPNAAQIRDVIHRCIATAPMHRPTAENVGRALNHLPEVGTTHEFVEIDATPPEEEHIGEVSEVPSRTALLPDEPEAEERAAIVPAQRIVLRSENGVKVDLGVSMNIGRAFCGRFGDDARFVAEFQFRLVRTAAGWFIEPAADATNDTLLNGELLEARRLLQAGDVIAVGRASRGVVKLPLSVSFS